MIRPTRLTEIAAAGWRVFPCREVDAEVKPKAPRIGDNLTAASCDPEILRMWWQRWPTAPIGFVPASAGFVVLDLVAGVDLGDLPPEWIETQLVRTPSGSLHVYFEAEPGVSYGNGKRPDLGPLVDVIRHADGYVIIPPTPGYSWIGEAEIMPAPAELRAPVYQGAGTAEAIFGRQSQQLDDRDVIPAGDQEAAIHARAFQIARHRPRPSEAEAIAMLWQFVQDRCPNTPGREAWREHHVADKIKRAFAVPIDAPISVDAEVQRSAELRLSSVLDVERKVATFVPGMTMRIPAGTISVLTGQQGAGKGTLLVAEAVGVAGRGGGVLIASDEDSVAYTLRPRLEVAAGDDFECLRRVHMLAGLQLPEHTAQLVELAEANKVRLLVVDPWTNHVGSINVDKSQELRLALMALKTACERTGMVALLVAHPNKNSENPDPIERVAHASALTQVARSAFWIVKDPRIDDGKDETDRLLVHVKHNLTARADTIEYKIETRRLEAPDDTVPLIVKTGNTSLDWLEVHKLKRQHETARPAERRDGAEQAIVEYLRTVPGCCARRSVIVARFDGEHSPATIDRAVAQLKRSGRIDSTSQGYYLLDHHESVSGDDDDGDDGADY